MNVLWSYRSSSNPKTGDMPTAYIGESRDETRASCRGCSLLGSGCYAWSGMAHAQLVKIQKRVREGHDHSLPTAIERRAKTARAVRLSAIGDPGHLGFDAVAAIQNAADVYGLAVLGYTHFWRRRTDPQARFGEGGESYSFEADPRLSSALMASCDTPEEADEAVAAGWKAAAIVDSIEPVVRTPGGKKLLRCPAQATLNRTQCNDCLLCDPRNLSSTDRYDGIYFRPHGNQTRRLVGRKKRFHRWNPRSAESISV